MRSLVLIIFSILSFNVSAAKNSIAVFETNFGSIEIELFENKAPISVANFKNYIKSGYYSGTIFHRVIDNFMVQGGGMTEDLKRKPTRSPIKNEATNKLSNVIGTVAMARTMVVDSATSQFFINVNDNNFLDHRNSTSRGYGYAVFGKVSKGMSIVNRMKVAKTKAKGPYQNLPVESIIIKKAFLK